MANPYCLAMVLSDGVHRDPATGKFTILGTFSTVGAQSYPVPLQFFIYFAVTDGLGRVTLRVQLIDASAGLVDAQDEQEQEGRVFLQNLEREFSSPFMVLEGVMGVQLHLPKPGQYHCELWADDELLMSRRLIATIVGKDMEEGEQEHA